MSRRPFSPGRRRFLHGLGATGLGLTATGLGGRLLQAAQGEAPRRLIVLSHCHGWPYDSWKIRPSGQSDSSAWQQDLTALAEADWSPCLAPLYAHREQLVVLDGLSLMTAELDGDGNRHDSGWVHAWTGNWTDFSGTDTRSTSASLDQVVASAISRIDRLPSLELSVDAGLESGRPISYAASGARLPVANTPALAWQRLFGLTANADPLVLRQRDALRYATGEYQAVCPTVSRTGQERLDAHYGLLQGLADRIEGLASLTCTDLPKMPGATTSFDETFDVMSELIAAAFACDITRVVSLSLGEMPTADFGWDHVTDDVHKGLAHNIYDSEDAHQAMTDYLTRHAGQVARLVSLLSSTPDSDGRSVMDNTLIVWGSELADGWHGYRHWNPVLIGGSWHFRGGLYHHWPHTTPAQMLVPQSISTSGYTDTCGIPHQRLLVSVAQAMGLSLDQIGIDMVQGQAGAWIDCRGPLEELT